MTSTHKKVRYKRSGKLDERPSEASSAAEEALRVIEGRWKLRILFHLNASEVLRFSELERAIPSVTQKMLIQQLRELERDGAVERHVHPEVPPRVEYRLTPWGLALCPALLALRQWAALRKLPIVAGVPEHHGPARAPMKVS